MLCEACADGLCWQSARLFVQVLHRRTTGEGVNAGLRVQGGQEFGCEDVLDMRCLRFCTTGDHERKSLSRLPGQSDLRLGD